MHKVIIKQDLLTHRLVFTLVTLPLNTFFRSCEIPSVIPNTNIEESELKTFLSV